MKTFPCPYCKGDGGELDPVTDDGLGPFYECQWCEGEGILEIGGKIHQKRRLEKIAIDLISTFSRDFELQNKELEKLMKELDLLGKKYLLPLPKGTL